MTVSYVCKKLIKNSQPFGKKFRKPVGGIFLTHTVDGFLKNGLNPVSIKVHFGVKVWNRIFNTIEACWIWIRKNLFPSWILSFHLLICIEQNGHQTAKI